MKKIISISREELKNKFYTKAKTKKSGKENVKREDTESIAALLKKMSA